MVVKRFFVFCLLSIAAFAFAGDDALVLIDRQSSEDRNNLLKAGIPLVLEHNQTLLAFGAEQALCSDLERLGYQHAVIDHPDGGSQYAVAAILGSELNPELSACGESIAGGTGWRLLKAASFDVTVCRSPRFMLRVLPMQVLEVTKPPPERYLALQTGDRGPVTVNPLIQDMVGNLTDDVAMSHWQAIMDSASTRYSYAQGCIDASAEVYALFDNLDLNPEYHNYSGSYPPNVVATLPGSVNPSEVVIVIGHLDSITYDDPMNLAPGADDNASGSAMVTAVAEAMSCYEFEKTVKFLTVTGEEQGLHGSSGYADDSNSAGMNIQAVLNGDMIAWEGDGIPATGETLDVHTNNGSVWLGNLMAQQSSTYDTGVPVNNFLCPGMTSSDHAPFWTHGWSAICGITDSMGWSGCPDADAGFNPYYHSNDDTIVNCGTGAPAFLGGNVRTFLATAADIAVPIAAKTAAPTGLNAEGDGANRIALSWATSGSGYQHEIFRAPGGCSNPGPTALIGSVGSTSYTDTTASGQMTYGYWLRSANGHCTSATSACVEASTTGACTEPPVFAGLETVTNQATASCGLELSWSAPSALYCGSNASFTIYRSTNPAFDPAPSDLIAEDVTATTLLDTDSLISGQRYYYIVRAVDTSNGVEDGNLTRVSGIPTGPITLGTWTDNAGDDGDALMTSQAPWSIHTDRTHSAPNAYGTGAYGNNVCAALTTPPIFLNSGAQLSFWSTYDIETDYDKGIVEISTNGGSTWEKVPVNYPDSVSHTGDACGLPTGDYFAKSPLVPWASYNASLAQWADDTVLIRWRISTDGGVTDTGWWIDDIEITNVGVPGDCSTAGASEIFADGFESGNLSAW